MILSIRTKLTLAFAFVAFVLILLTAFLANTFLESHFRQYIIEKQEQRNEEFVSLIRQQYIDKGSWRIDTIENIGVSALEQGLIIKVTDSSGKTIWDATVHNSGLCRQMIEHMIKNMVSRYPGWKGQYTIDEYPLWVDFEEVGKVEIGYYGPFYYDDSDLYFIKTLNTTLIWVAIIALLISVFIGAYLSRRLSVPITKASETAQRIAKGDYSQRSKVNTSTKEIRELITAVNDLAETLENQEHLRKRLTADVSHELRTPLTTLQSHLEAMIDGIWQPTAERLKSCYDEIIRISKMVNDLHFLAEVEGESHKLNKTNFDLYELTSNIVLNFQSQFKNKNVGIVLEGSRQELYADKDKISQVIINLVSNGLKYTPSGGLVKACVTGDKKTVKLIIQDNGEGISEEDVPNIFERFYRADKSRNRLTGGSGIGLAIVKAIVEVHHGSVEVESTVGVGTRFTVSLPRQ
ncbi:MAG: HAMP domain-containing protein [Clostridiaceae bacterium]|nr:HAMP domain-containing protein [Clostridiaceae bacterium]